MTDQEIEHIVLKSVDTMNQARKPEAHLDVSSTAVLFGPASPLDSLGLVSLLMDVEEALAERGVSVMLSDARAMSQRNSPFRNVPSLVQYIRDVMPPPA